MEFHPDLRTAYYLKFNATLKVENILLVFHDAKNSCLSFFHHVITLSFNLNPFGSFEIPADSINIEYKIINVLVAYFRLSRIMVLTDCRKTLAA